LSCLLYSVSATNALDLRPTISPWLEDGTNIFQRVARNVCIGIGPTATDALSLCTAPVASATRALVNLSNTALSGASASGTYVGANPAACAGDFFNLQVASVAKGIFSCAGQLTLSTIAITTSDVIQYTTPVGSSIPTKIRIANFDPGAFGQIIAMGLASGSTASARVISILDQRVAGHQPSLAVFSPNENQYMGLTWNGSNTQSELSSTQGIQLSPTATYQWAAPTGTLVPAMIGIPSSLNPGDFGQNLAMGLPATASATARAILMTDARTVVHQPTFLLLSPNEAEGVGLSYEGSNTLAYIKSSVAIALQAGSLSGTGTTAWYVTSGGLFGVGSATVPVDPLSMTVAPTASATRALINISNTALNAGSANGTYIGGNPAACTGNFVDFQLAGAARALLTCAGAWTAISFNTITGIGNPTGTVGLSVVNGTATTLMRSDGAPPLSQAIAPTWTGAHIYDNTIALTTNSYFKGNAASGYRFNNAADTLNLVVIQDDGDVYFNQMPSASGVRYLCIDTAGKIASQAAACVGT
jgi:hypothetical protein